MQNNLDNAIATLAEYLNKNDSYKEKEFRRNWHDSIAMCCLQALENSPIENEEKYKIATKTAEKVLKYFFQLDPSKIDSKMTYLPKRKSKEEIVEEIEAIPVKSRQIYENFDCGNYYKVKDIAFDVKQKGYCVNYFEVAKDTLETIHPQIIFTTSVNYFTGGNYTIKEFFLVKEFFVVKK